MNKFLHIGSGLLLVLGLSACATPATTLRNASGQEVKCGGDRGSSAAFGMLGYERQKIADQECVDKYKGQGYREVGPKS